ncbi:MAG TPA: orotidine-5'-phosphate decarboxylase [Patescibacteria group bacterium]|jgi:uridine monophosphate synthetase
MSDRLHQTFAERAELAASAVAQRLFKLMTKKESNLCLALDETDPDRFLTVAESLGPHLAVLKTHIDTLSSFTSKLTIELANLAREHDFLIFEDRKFADTGTTVKNQYTKGLYSIMEWADIVNAHALPGPSIVEGLREEVENRDLLERRAILLLAQMSPKGNMLDAAYTKKVVAMAKEYPDFVMGFVGTGPKALPALAREADPGQVIFAPGAKIGEKDKLGPRYSPPEDLVEAGADVLIVGRGIWEDPKPLRMAKDYRERCWGAYQQRIAAPKVGKKK